MLKQIIFSFKSSFLNLTEPHQSKRVSISHNGHRRQNPFLSCLERWRTRISSLSEHRLSKWQSYLMDESFRGIVELKNLEKIERCWIFLFFNSKGFYQRLINFFAFHHEENQLI